MGASTRRGDSTSGRSSPQVPSLRWNRGYADGSAKCLDEVADKGSCDFVQDVALLFPNVIFMDLFGLPRDDAHQFRPGRSISFTGAIARWMNSADSPR